MRFLTFAFILILILPINCFACKLGITDVVYEKPELAQTIMLLKVIKKNNKNTLVFQAHPYWGDKKITASSSYCTGYNGYDIGSSGIYYSSLSEKEIFLKVIDANDGLFVDFKDTVSMKDTLEWLSKIKEIPKGRPNVFWGFCENDSECTQTRNSCGNQVGINLKFKANYNGYLEKNKFPKKCSSKKKVESVSKCIKNFCS